MCKKWLRKNASFVVAVLLLGVLVGSVTGCVAESHEPYTQNYSALTTATDFSLGGEDRYFDKLQKDEENVLLFWGSWCPHCESLIERIDQLDSADAIKKNLFTVAEDESLDDVEGHKGDFPIYLDQDKSVYEAYGLEHIPTVFILNDQGEVLGSAQGEEDSLALMAFADIGGEPANPGGSGDIYVPDNYQDPGIMPLERGQCTDVYSKAWCDSHGYKNNRPVPKAVPLNAKERECYWGLMRSGSKAALCAMVGNVGGCSHCCSWSCFYLIQVL